MEQTRTGQRPHTAALLPAVPLRKPVLNGRRGRQPDRM